MLRNPSWTEVMWYGEGHQDPFVDLRDSQVNY